MILFALNSLVDYLEVIRLQMTAAVVIALQWASKYGVFQGPFEESPLDSGMNQDTTTRSVICITRLDSGAVLVNLAGPCHITR